MRVKCTRCTNGVVSYEEDGRIMSDACYHCGTEGFIDEEQAFHDKLLCVAELLAYQQVSDRRERIDQDPEGENWAFLAAEHMMTAHDFFVAAVYDETYSVMEKLSRMNRADQEFLVAWSNLKKED